MRCEDCANSVFLRNDNFVWTVCVLEIKRTTPNCAYFKSKEDDGSETNMQKL